MHTALKQAFENEIALARIAIEKQQWPQTQQHLERAHILGQRFVRPHVRSHWLMLRVALKRKTVVPALGQFIRLVLGALGSSVGVVPIGNTGSSDVGMFKRMPIDGELQKLLQPPQE